MTETDTTDAGADAQDETHFTDDLENARVDLGVRAQRLEQAAATIGALQSDLETLASDAGTHNFEACVHDVIVTSDGSETTEELQVRATLDSIEQFHSEDLPNTYNWQHYGLTHRDGQFQLKADLWLDSVVSEDER